MKLTIEQAMQQAVAAHNQGQLEEAERVYNSILQSQPTHAEANHNLGLIALSLNKAKTAISLFKSALEAKPHIGQFWISYIDALIKDKQIETAKSVLEQGKNTGLFGSKFNQLEQQLNTNNVGPSNTQINSLLEHYNNGQYEETEKLALAITEQFPAHPFGWKVLGAVFGDIGRYSDAVDANQKAILLMPEDPETHNNLGNVLKELARLDEAEVSLEQALALKPNYADAHNNLGAVLVAQDNLHKAEINIKRAIALNPNYAQAYNNLGLIFKEQGKLTEAATNFRQTISLNPEIAEAHSNLGATLRLLGRLDDAEASSKQAVKIKPDSPTFVLNLATVFNYMNNLEAATRAYEKVLQIDPNNLGLSAGVSLALIKYLDGEFAQSKTYLLGASKIQEKTTIQFKNHKVFHSYLLTILNWHEKKFFDHSSLISNRSLYVIGESHSLVSHWLQVQRYGQNIIGKAKLIEGSKQWHLGNSSNNQYKAKYKKIINTLPEASDILLAMGEIDCRIDGGIIKHKHKYPEKNITKIIKTTVDNYLYYIFELNESRKNNIIIQGVPCPNIDTTNIAPKDISELIEVIRIFNIELKNKSKEKCFGFLDLHKLTDRGDGFSNSKWHTDAYHISPEGMQEAWRIHYSE